MDICSKKSTFKYYPNRETIWHCRDGKKCNVYEMKLSHLKNSAFKVARDSWRKEWLPILVQELRDRGCDGIADEVINLDKMNEALG